MRTVIQGATIVTMDAPGILENHHLIIENDKISDITSSLPSLDNSSRIIDARGKILLPGLINSHTHVAMSLFRSLGEDIPNRLTTLLFPLERDYLTPDLVYRASCLTLLEMIKSGTTTFADMYYFMDKVAQAAHDVGIRALLGQTITNFPTPDASDYSQGFEQFHHLSQKHKDSSLVSFALAPHAPYTTGDIILQKCEEISAYTKTPLLIHLAEMDREKEHYKKHGGSSVKYLHHLGILSPRLVGAHGIFLDEEDIELLRKSECSIVHNPISNAKSGRPIAPILTLREKGVKVGLGTDGPMSGNHMDMINCMAITPVLQKVKYRQRDIFSAQDVLRMATIEGAASLGLAHKIGSLSPGKQADILIINPYTVNMLPIFDYYSALVYAMQPNNIESVFINGTMVLANREFPNLSEESCLKEFSQATTSLRKVLLKM